MSATETEKPGWTIAALEPVLGDLKATVGILGHMFNEHQSVGLEEWHRIEGELIRLTDGLREIWQQAWDHAKAERVTLADALAAEKARNAAPGSPGDIEHAFSCWRLLRSAAEIALQECDKSDPRARSPGKKKRRGRAGA
jgi:hypothetical protein